MAFIALFEAEATCSLHWSFESKVTPKMLMTFFEITNLSLMLTTSGGQSCLQNKHRSVLDSLTTIPDCVSHLIMFSNLFFMRYWTQLQCRHLANAISNSSTQAKKFSSIIPSIENRNKKLWQNNIILKAALKRKQSNTRKNMPVQTLLLHKIYNDIDQGADWLALNFNQNFNNRNPKFLTTDSSKFKIGKNITSNKLISINSKIQQKDLNDKMPVFKVKMKLLFLS